MMAKDHPAKPGRQPQLPGSRQEPTAGLKVLQNPKVTIFG
jgi:hypothetical protein